MKKRASPGISKTNVPAASVQICSAWGSIKVDLVDGMVVRCALPLLAEPPKTAFAIEERGKDPASGFVAAALSGKTGKPPAIGTLEGTAFQQKVWKAIAAIPAGATKSYGELAKAVGRPRACRAVANACGKNPVPLFIPCHRVVAAHGNIGGFSSGIAWKRHLLSVERIRRQST